MLHTVRELLEHFQHYNISVAEEKGTIFPMPNSPMLMRQITVGFQPHTQVLLLPSTLGLSEWQWFVHVTQAAGNSP